MLARLRAIQALERGVEPERLFVSSVSERFQESLAKLQQLEEILLDRASQVERFQATHLPEFEAARPLEAPERCLTEAVPCIEDCLRHQTELERAVDQGRQDFANKLTLLKRVRASLEGTQKQFNKPAAPSKESLAIGQVGRSALLSLQGFPQKRGS
jgi:hypothetical protein